MDVTSYLLGKKSGGGGSSNLQTKSVSVTSNGTSTINPDEGYDGLTKVNLTTNVQPNLESKSITITENGTTNVTPTAGKDGLSSVQVTTNVSGGGGKDWSAIGYSSEPKASIFDYDYAKEIYDNWDATITSANQKYKCQYGYEHPIRYFPNVNTSNITSMSQMFQKNYSLEEIPDGFDFSNVVDMSNMFADCYYLRYVNNVLPKANANMQGAFSNCQNLKSVNKIRITNNSSTRQVFSNITGLTINEVLMSIASSGNSGTYFNNCYNLDIKKITNENGITHAEKLMMNTACTMTNGTIDEFLKYFSTLTTQSSDYKTLRAMGFSSTSCNQAVQSSYWQQLVEAGWTTGY